MLPPCPFPSRPLLRERPPSAKATTETKRVCLGDGLLDCSQMSNVHNRHKETWVSLTTLCLPEPTCFTPAGETAHLDPGEVLSHQEAEEVGP